MNRRLALFWVLAAANVALLLQLGWLATHPLPADAPPAPASAPTTTPASPPARPAAPATQALTAVWEQPLFSPERQPDAPAAIPTTPVLDGVALTGVLLGHDGQWALLTIAGQSPRKLRLGATLEDGWTLSTLSARSATFSRRGTTRTLHIPILRLPAFTRSPFLPPPNNQAP